MFFLITYPSVYLYNWTFNSNFLFRIWQLVGSKKFTYYVCTWQPYENFLCTWKIGFLTYLSNSWASNILKEMNMTQTYLTKTFSYISSGKCLILYVLCVLIFNHSLKDTSRVLKIFLVDPKAWVSRVFSCKIVLSRVTFLCAIAYYRCIPIKEDLPSRNVHFFGKDTKKLFIPYHNNLPYIILRGKNGAHVQQDSCILKNDLILNCGFVSIERAPKRYSVKTLHEIYARVKCFKRILPHRWDWHWVHISAWNILWIS